MPQARERAERLLLTVDISNTGIKFGVYPVDGEALRARWRIATAREQTTDEYAMLLANLCRHAGLRLDDIADVIISSVVPPLTPVFHELATGYLGREPIIVTYQTPLGIRLLVDNPWETGTDRMLSALATHSLYGGPAIVIQFGTATSFDCVSAEGDFLGGAI
ncbi:MAG TPA: type III pantothenate kinase, partial [Ktedonobacterales bacterium]|nr:type III pantothenate kinase [Ktedonobacterales bacterium]